MTAPATVLQGTQVGKETTPGTTVAASKLLKSFELAPQQKQNNTSRRTRGWRYPVGITRGKRWTESKIDGFLAFNDIAYLLSSLYKTATPTSGGGGEAAAQTWVFGPSVSASDAMTTYTFENGDATQARKFGYGLVTQLALDQEDSGVKLGGNVIGQALTTGITKTAAPTEVLLVPADGISSTAGFAGTFAGAATGLTGALNIGVELGEHRKPVFTATTDTSFSDHVEGEAEFSAKLLVRADAAGDSLLADQANGTLKFFDWTIQGAVIPTCTTSRWTVKVRAACEVTDVSEYKDEDGVYALEATLTGRVDPTTSKAVEVTVINNIATL